MSGPSRADFEQAIDQYWHDRPPASLEDVMALYGVLAVAESGGELFETASQLDPYVDDGRLVTIHVDLTDDSAEYLDTRVDALRAEDVPQLGYSGKQSGRGADYSVTQAGSKNGNEPEKLADTHVTRIRRWCEYDSVRKVVGPNGHPDGWVVERLGDVFEKDSESLQRIRDDVAELLTGSEPTVITVAVRLDEADLDSHDDEGVDEYYPGELQVLQAALRRYRTENQADKNLSSKRSEGEGYGFVTGSEGRVVGTPDSPLDLFSVKHPDAQPALRRDDSWRNYPIDEQTALLFDKGSELVEQCVFRNGGMETYALPYFSGELTARKAETLYNAVASLDPDSNDTKPPMARVTYAIAESEDEAVRELGHELRFYYVTLPIDDDAHVVAEVSAATTYWVNEIADALIDTVRGPTGTVRAGGFPESENWPLLDFPDDTDAARRSAFYSVVGYEFTNSTFAYRDDVDDDFRRVVDQQLIEGTPIDVSVLYEEYVARFGDEFDGDPVPWQVPAMQFVQLEALSRAGLLTGLESSIEPTPDTMTQALTELTDIDEIRESRLESFINRPLFEDDTDRTAAFLGGVLIGQVSWYQENERSVGQPLDTRTRADKLTPHALEQAIRTALEKAKVYAAESEHESDVLYAEVVDRLLDALERQPTEWDLDKHELQFMVSIGQSYGRRAMPCAYEIYQENSEDTDTPTPPQEA